MGYLESNPKDLTRFRRERQPPGSSKLELFRQMGAEFVMTGGDGQLGAWPVVMW